ncbi:type II secretion system F family protein [Escherichia coli]
MFWRDITLSVWRKKTTGLKTKKRLLPLVLAAALCSSPVWAEEATFTANFKDTDLKSFIETVGANLNKTIIMGPGVQGKVSIRTMTPLNERQYYQLFLNLLEAQGYAVVPMENDVLKVVKSSAAKVEPLPLVGEGSDNYAGDEMVTKVVPVLQAMLYPLVLLVVATGVVTILLTAVVPKIIEQFDHLGHALPATTRALIAMSDALQASGVYWLAGLLALLVLGQRLLKNPAMRLRRDKTLLRLPVTGRVARGLNTARFSRTLSILTASSVPLLEGIQTAAAVSANRYVEQQLLLAADRVREGSSLRAALAELRLFPPMMLYMIASGEQSGELETMLEQAAVNQEREFDTQVGLALGLFEPALVVMMAGVVLFIVIAILEPMLQLNNMVGM